MPSLLFTFVEKMQIASKFTKVINRKRHQRCLAARWLYKYKGNQNDLQSYQ